MVTEMRVRVRVLPGRTIQIPAPELSEGDLVDVSVVLAEESSLQPETGSEERSPQIEAPTMSTPPSAMPADGWLATVGQYPEDSPLNRAFDAGYRLRERERKAK